MVDSRSGHVAASAVIEAASDVWNSVRSKTSQVRSQHLVVLELGRVRVEPGPAARLLGGGEHLAQRLPEFLGLEVLGEVAVGAGLGAPVAVARRVEGREQHDRDVCGRPILFEQPGGDVARHARHLHVHDDRIGLQPVGGLDGFQPVFGGGDDLEALAGEDARDDLAQGRAVVGDDDARST